MGSTNDVSAPQLVTSADNLTVHGIMDGEVMEQAKTGYLLMEELELR